MWSDHDVPDGELDPDLRDLILEWRHHSPIPTEWLVVGLVMLSWIGLLATFIHWLLACQTHGGHLIPTSMWFVCQT